MSVSLVCAGIAVAALSAAGCKRSSARSGDAVDIQPAFERLHHHADRVAGAARPATAPRPAAAAGAPTDAATPAAAGDHIEIVGRHEPPQPSDPVRVRFRRFRVTQADFDPRHPQGGSANIEIDLASVSTGDPQRDALLRSARYLDVARFPKARIRVSDVSKVDGDHYTAEAKIWAHGRSVIWPVTFDIVSSGANSIRVRGSQIFDRREFGIGQEIGDPLGREISIDLLLTLRPTQ